MTSASSSGKVAGVPNIVEIAGKRFIGVGSTGDGNRYFSDHMNNFFKNRCFQRKQRNSIVAGERCNTEHA